MKARHQDIIALFGSFVCLLWKKILVRNISVKCYANIIWKWCCVKILKILLSSVAVEQKSEIQARKCTSTEIQIYLLRDKNLSNFRTIWVHLVVLVLFVMSYCIWWYFSLCVAFLSRFFVLALFLDLSCQTILQTNVSP